jgi:mannose-1-phosphate guanylyltransferase
MFAVVKNHEPFYQPELADVDESRIVIQPANRGTTAAILYSLLRLSRLEEDPIVAFFPADHHFANETQFARAVDGAFEAVHKSPQLLVLLGVTPDKAEVEYGWIEPGLPMDGGRGSSGRVFRVNRFWEKPCASTAQGLLSAGCLLNTFVLAGRARTFLEVIESAAQDRLRSFEWLADAGSREEEMERAAALYKTLPMGDFSREVLTRCPERLAVLRMDGAGWGDLGTPEGILAAMRKTEAVTPPAPSHAFSLWLAAYSHRLEEVCRQAAGEPVAAERHH